MEKREAEHLARVLIDEWLSEERWHGERWEFKWSQSRTFAAQTHFPGVFSNTRPTVRLSAPFVAVNDEAQVRDALLHEVAHVLAGPDAGHGPHWKSLCLRVGANPSRVSDGVPPLPKYVARCEQCGYRYTANRKNDRSRCRAPLPKDGKRSYLNGTCPFGQFKFVRFEESGLTRADLRVRS